MQCTLVHNLALLQASDSERSATQLPALDSPECGNHIVGGSLDIDSEFERRLAIGARLACQLRTTVKDKLGVQSTVCSVWHAELAVLTVG